MKKLQVVEPMHSGHHTNYLLALIPGIESLRRNGVLGSAVFSITAEHFDRLKASGDVERAGDAVEWDPTLVATPPDPSMADRRRLHDSMQSVVSRQRADALLCTTADYDLIPSAIRNLSPAKAFWPERSAGVIHFGFPKGTLSRSETAKRIVYEASWALSRWQQLLMVNPLLYEGLLARGRDMTRYRMLPDPVPDIRIDRDTARDRLGLARDGTYIGCIGMMDRRKAIPELLKAFMLADLGPDVRLFLAGRIDSDYRRMIDTDHADQIASGRIQIIDRELSESEVACGYAAIDLHSVLQYRRFNLSANVLKCVAAGKPFVADRTGFAALVADRFAAGAACDVHDIGSIAAALRDGIDPGRAHQINPATARLREFHSHENFARTAMASVLGADAVTALGGVKNWTHAYGHRDASVAVTARGNRLGGVPA